MSVIATDLQILYPEVLSSFPITRIDIWIAAAEARIPEVCDPVFTTAMRDIALGLLVAHKAALAVVSSTTQQGTLKRLKVDDEGEVEYHKQDSLKVSFWDELKGTAYGRDLLDLLSDLRSKLTIGFSTGSIKSNVPLRDRGNQWGIIG